jgi:hypothetical protein
MKNLKIIFDDKNQIYSHRPITFFDYFIKNIINIYKESIKNMILIEVDFSLSIDILKSLILSIEERIDYLVIHPEFDPFKKELIKKDKEEYNYYPFEWKSIHYYLYPRMGYEIDREIDNLFVLKKLLEKQINANKPLEFVFENLI